MSAEMLVVKPECCAVAAEKCHRLIKRHTGHEVGVMVKFGLWRTTFLVTIVDDMMSTAVIQANRTRSAVIVVLHRQRNCSAENMHRVIQYRRINRSWVLRIEIRHIAHRTYLPMLGHLISEPHKTVVFIKAHVGAMATCAAVVEARRMAVFAFAELVGNTGINGVVRTGLRMDIRQHGVVLRLACDNIDDTSHGIRTIEERSRSSDDFNPFSEHGLVVVGYWMTVDACVLRQTIDEHEHACIRCAANATHFDATRTTRTHAVTHHTALRNEQTRHFGSQRGQDIRLVSFFELRLTNHADRHRQQTRVGLRTCAGSHHFLQLNRPQRVLCFGRAHAQKCR